MGARVLDKDGKEVTPIMGSYGIGIERILCAAIELSHDRDGMSLPAAIAPFAVIVTPVNFKADPFRSMPDDQWFWHVSEGVQGSVMPPWKESLTESQRWNVIHYIQEVYASTFERDPDDPEGDLGFMLTLYLGILLMIELDARKFGIREVKIETPPMRELLLKYGYHLSSLFTIVIFMLGGFTAILSVFFASVVAFGLSWLRSETRLTLPRLLKALESGAKQVLSVAATCAAAGIIIGVFTLTGLGLKLSGIIVDLAGSGAILIHHTD